MSRFCGGNILRFACFQLRWVFLCLACCIDDVLQEVAIVLFSNGWLCFFCRALPIFVLGNCVDDMLEELSIMFLTDNRFSIFRVRKPRIAKWIILGIFFSLILALSLRVPHLFEFLPVLAHWDDDIAVVISVLDDLIALSLSLSLAVR